MELIYSKINLFTGPFQKGVFNSGVSSNFIGPFSEKTINSSEVQIE